MSKTAERNRNGRTKKGTNDATKSADVAPTKPGGEQYDVSAEEFVRVWQTSASSDEAAERLKMPKPIVHSRASAYRKVGVKLKKMPRPKNAKLDVSGLNNLVDTIAVAQKESAKKGVTAEEVRQVVDEVLGRIHGGE